MNKNNNIAFLHIPKNAGTTFFYVLGSQYSPKERFDVQVIDNSRMNTDDFISMPRQQREQIKLISGHFRYGIHQHLFGDTDYVTFLRNPLSRIPSYYNFVLSQPNHALYQQVHGQGMNLHDFVTKVQRGDIHNAQIRMISGLNATPEIMLEKALENIEKSFSQVLLTDRFNQSVILFKRHYRVKNIRYLYENKTPESETMLQKSTINQSTLNAIAELNAGDMQLYKTMSKKFEQNWQQVRFKKLELINLKLNNRILQTKTLLRELVKSS